jgi:hypothetical protein
MSTCIRCDGRGWVYEYGEEGFAVGQSSCECPAGEAHATRIMADHLDGRLIDAQARCAELAAALARTEAERDQLRERGARDDMLLTNIEDRARNAEARAEQLHAAVTAFLAAHDSGASYREELAAMREVTAPAGGGGGQVAEAQRGQPCSGGDCEHGIAIEDNAAGASRPS